jgi:DNA-binding MarR family transcriptional regulator
MPEQEGLDNQIIIAIRRISQAVETYSRFLWQEYGLTAPQLGTLRELQQRGPSAPTQIAGWMSISPSTTTGILKRLEQRELIDRCPDPVDGRSTLVKITDKGTELAMAAPSLLRDHFRNELSRLPTWERTQILATLQRVARMMNADELEEAPFFYTETVETDQGANGAPAKASDADGSPGNHKETKGEPPSSPASPPAPAA